MRRAVSFLTPFGGPADPAPSALAWFPAVGALIGLAVGGIWWAARRPHRCRDQEEVSTGSPHGP